MTASSDYEISCENLLKFFIEEGGLKSIKFLSDGTKRECEKFLENSAKLEKITPFVDKNEKDMKVLEKITKANVGLSKASLNLWKLLLFDALKRLDNLHHNEGKGIEEDITGVNELASYLDKFRNFEMLLYGSSEWYRDHIWHLLWCFFVGEYMFSKCKLLGKIDREWYSKDKEAQFCVVALCHDLGYPIEKIEDINKSLKDMLNEYRNIRFEPFRVDFPITYKHTFDYLLDRLSLSVKPVHKNNKFVLKEFNDRTYVKTVDKICQRPNIKAYFSSLLSKLDHGVISCLLLVDKLERFRRDTSIDYKITLQEGNKFWVDRDFMVSQYILKPIAYHSGRNVVIRTGEKDLIYLWFMLCDDLAEWHRPTRGGGAELISRQCRVYIESLDIDNISIMYLFNISSEDREPRYFFADKVFRYYSLLDDNLTLKIVVEDKDYRKEKYEYLYDKKGVHKSRSIKMTCKHRKEFFKKNEDLKKYMKKFNKNKFREEMRNLRICPKCNG